MGRMTPLLPKLRLPLQRQPRAKAQAKARKRLEREFSVEGGSVAHRLEVRIQNTERPNRVVVGRYSERMRGPEEASCRGTALLDSCKAGPEVRFHQMKLKS